MGDHQLPRINTIGREDTCDGLAEPSDTHSLKGNPRALMGRRNCPMPNVITGARIEP
jgi:hypothetical protein